MSEGTNASGEAGIAPGLLALLGAGDPLAALSNLLRGAQADLATTVVEGSAGGGVVTVGMTGERRLTRVSIDPELLAAGDADILSDLIIAAANDAYAQAEGIKERAVSGLTGFDPR